MTRAKQTRLYVVPEIRAALHKATRIERKRREKTGESYRRFGLVDMLEYLIDQYLAENAPQQPPADSG